MSRRMFRYVDALCLLPLYVPQNTHTHTHCCRVPFSWGETFFPGPRIEEKLI